MPTLTIRSLDEDVIKRLKQRAAANHRSLEAEVRALLEREVAKSSRTAFVERSRAIRAMTPPGSPVDTTDVIRRWRDRDNH